ncbi:MAG: hypothetical protein WAU88_15070 [Candidatus Zixiibacteriota bacterium]
MRLTIPCIAILLLCVSCSDKDPVSPDVVYPVTIQVRFHQSTQIPGTGHSLRFDQMPYDGRLPSGVVDSTWWTNTAKTQWTLLPSGAKLHLYVSGEIPDSVGVHFDCAPAAVGGYSFRIVELNPLPSVLLSPVPDSELVATVEVDLLDTPAPGDACGFPLALGNRWIYLDSVFESDTLLEITTDTMMIEEEFTDLNGHWWVWKRWQDPFGRTSMVRGDTIFSQQDAYAPLPGGAPFYFISKEIIPPVGDSSRYMIIFGGDMVTYRDAVRLHSPFTAPVGSFDNCLKFTSDLGYVTNTEILAPGVGFIFQREDFTYGVPPPKSYHRWLISYELH